MKEAKFKYKNESIANAFEDELIKIGFSKVKITTPYDCYISIFNSGSFQRCWGDFPEYDNEFQLESQYQEALDFANQQIEEYNKPNASCKQQALRSEFKEGDWVHYNPTGYVGLLVNDADWNGECYKSTVESANYEPNKYRRATKEEIEQALIKEFDRRYMPDGESVLSNAALAKRRFKPLENWKIMESINYRYYSGIDCFYIAGNLAYYNGDWAEIIEPKLTIAGYEVEDLGDRAKIGCKKLHWGHVDDFITICDRFDVQTIVTDHGDVTKQELKELRKRYLQ